MIEKLHEIVLKPVAEIRFIRQMILSDAMILPVSQLQTQQVMTSQKLGHA